MHWSFEHFTFDSDRGVLRQGEAEVLLEPKASALLSYFCQNNQRDISRDELIKHVWHAQIVSDNAINRVVVKLRKALGDEGKPWQFIATVPKVGYRFIGQPQQVQAPIAEVESATDRRTGWKGFVPGLLAVAAIAWLVGGFLFDNFFFGSGRAALPQTVASIEPVSREARWQFDADLSPNEQHLIFSVGTNAGNTLYLQTLSDGQLAQVSPDTGNASSGRWSHDGKSFVYLYHQGQACSFHKVLIDADGNVVTNELLQSCNLNSGSSFALSLDDEILYFVERANAFSPYVAYALDMQEQQRWRLPQPLATSFGNHYVDVHPVTGKVLLLSEPRPGTSALFEIDVPANEFKRLQSFDYDLYSAIWGHEANTVVHPAEHPSYQLLKTDLTTGQSTVLVSDSRRISTPRRINNGQDYLFASYLNNRDVEVDGYSGTNFNSAVMDYLPELSNDGNQLAFVSKRSGFSEVLLLDLSSQELTTLKSDDEGMTFYNLSWSPDDRRLAANTSKGIVIYNLRNQARQVLPIEQLTYAVDWYSDTELTYSEYVDGEWNAYLRTLDGDIQTPFPEGVLYVLTDDNVHVHVDRGHAYATRLSPHADIRHYDLSACGERYLGRFQSNLKFDGGKVYCPDPENRNQLLFIDPGQAASVFPSDFANAEFYSVSGTQFARTRTQMSSSDVMRTRKQTSASSVLP